MKLSDREWKEFKVEDIFDVFNSTPYHKKSLKVDINNNNSIPYITRTNKNNGLENVVLKENHFKSNPKNIIIFGAENATFFYQPFEHITGNKMYGIRNENLNIYIGLFIQQVLNSSIKNCGFSYGQGLTGTREKRRSVMLPILSNNNEEPDWQFMENYIKTKYNEKKEKYKKYKEKTLKELKYKEIEDLNKKNWKEFFITDIFKEIQRGKRLVKTNQIKGEIPYVSSTSLNNGIDNFISNQNKVRSFCKCLTIANSGSVGYCFYHDYEFIASDHVTHLKNNCLNKYVYLFISTLLSRLSEKYNFNREINDIRISREKILLPVNNKNEPDYEYMEQYIKNIMIKKYKQYKNN